MARSTAKNHSFFPKIPKQGKRCSPVIIQCPACQTKFSVPSSMLTAGSVSRFHCSRCDFIFAHEADVRLEERKETISNDGEEISGYPDPIEKDEFFEEPVVQPELLTPKSFTIPEKIESTRNLLPPHEQLPENDQFWTLERDPNQIEFKFPPAPHRKQIIADSVEAKFPSKKSGFSLAGISNAIPEENYRDAPSEVPPLEKLKTGQKLAPVYKRFSNWRGSAFLITPLVGLLTLLVLISVILQHFSTGERDLTSWVTPALPSIAPANLILDDLNFRLVNLESGESIPVISGKIINDTEESFSDIIIEGLAFDELGRNIGRTRVSAASTLAKTRIKSLSLPMIKELQSSKPSKTFLSAPRGEHDFSLALLFDNDTSPFITQDPVSKTKYFSARIYSVDYH